MSGYKNEERDKDAKAFVDMDMDGSSRMSANRTARTIASKIRRQEQKNIQYVPNETALAHAILLVVG